MCNRTCPISCADYYPRAAPYILWQIHYNGYLYIMNRKVVFYDGDCGFCNRTVQLILKHEKNSELHFCALQSEVTNQFFEHHDQPKPDLSTIVYFDGRNFSTHSTAVLKIATNLKFPVSLVRLGWVVPSLIRNYVYTQIARRRYRIVNPSCMLPNSEQKHRFLVHKWW